MLQMSDEHADAREIVLFYKTFDGFSMTKEMSEINRNLVCMGLNIKNILHVLGCLNIRIPQYSRRIEFELRTIVSSLQAVEAVRRLGKRHRSPCLKSFILRTKGVI